MSVLKSGLVCLIVLMDYTFSVASENNETNATQTNGTYWQTIVNCMDKRSKLLTYCVFKQSLRRLDEVIYSNETWQLNSYVSMKKNEGWKPIELEARAMRSPYGQIMSRISDLLTSRSLQFTLPQNGNGDRREARSKYAFGSGGNGAGSSSIAMGRKKKHKGMKFSGIALAAMLAQLFLGKIAFLAGVSLLLSKIALLFSIFNALKKQTGGSSGGEHVVYEREPGHGGTYQRSIPEINENWNQHLI